MRKFYLLAPLFPLVILTSCSNGSLSSTQALNALEVIEYHQRDTNFQFPNAVTLIIEETTATNSIKMGQRKSVGSSVIKTITYDKDNNFFSFTVVDKNDSDNNYEYYFYATGLSLYEARKSSSESTYAIDTTLTYQEIQKKINEKAISFNIFNILLGIEEVNDLSSIFYNDMLGAKAYEALLDSDTTLERFEHYFSSDNESSLYAKENIVYTYYNDDGEGTVMTENISNREINFANNLMILDNSYKEIFYRFVFDNQVVREETTVISKNIEVSLSANITIPDLSSYTRE